MTSKSKKILFTILIGIVIFIILSLTAIEIFAPDQKLQPKTNSSNQNLTQLSLSQSESQSESKLSTELRETENKQNLINSNSHSKPNKSDASDLDQESQIKIEEIKTDPEESQNESESMQKIQTMKVDLYLGDGNLISQGQSCDAVIKLEREITDDDNFIKNTLFELFTGETALESKQNYFSAFKDWDQVFNSIELSSDGTLQIDFKAEILPQNQNGEWLDQYGWSNLGSSCGSAQLQQIYLTSKQFSEVNYVIFSVDGELKKPNNQAGCPNKNDPKPDQIEESIWIEWQKQCGL